MTGALRHLLNAQSTRFAAWRAVAPDNEAASKRAEQLAAECRQSPWYASAPPWPPLGVRADAVGFGQWVHPAQAAAANAEQTMAQELMNFLQCEPIALHLFAQTLHRMASAMEDTAAVLLAELAIERMDDVLADHQRLAEAHRDDKNIYMVVRGRGT